jgi:hypothetical protein
MQQAQPLACNLGDQKIDAGRVAARPGKVRDQTELDGVFGDAKDNRDCCGRGPRRSRSRLKAGDCDHCHATADELAHERRRGIVLARQPMKLGPDVLPLDGAGLGKALAEIGLLGGIGGAGVDERDHRERGLLRPRRKRPSRGCSAEQSDEVAPSHGRPSSRGTA